MGKQLTTAEYQAFCRAFARKHHAMLDGAAEHTQLRLINEFNKRYDALIAKYPHLDLESLEFRIKMNEDAEEWWRTKAMRGTAVDW
jgi:hypothetical protein